MAVIREELVLADKFSSTFARFEQLAEQSLGALNDVRYSLTNIETASATSAQAMQNMANRTESGAKRAAASTDALGSSIKRLAGQFLGLQAVRGIINLSDTLTATTARLDMMNDGLQTTEHLNNMIFESANRSRGSYQSTADMVAKLGVLAGNAFSSSAEIVAFAEQLNKQMAIAGTTTAGAQAAMLQLTQAMASGVLRGEELNSILEQAPTIAQSIADYLGVDVGTMRQLASEGKVTADVVKNALFAAADETNAKFEQMPYTWGQVWTQAQNVMIQTFQPVLQVLGKLADFAGENIDLVIGLLYGLAAAATVYATAQWIATDAAKAFFATMGKHPVLLAIAAAIGVIVALVYNWIQAAGGIEVAWMKAMNWVKTVLDNVKIALYTAAFAIQEWGAKLDIGLTKAWNGIANGVDWLKAQVLTGIEGMVNGAIDLINSFIEVLNKIPGVSIEAIEHVTFGAEAQLEYEANKQARAEEVAKMQAELDQMVADHQQQLYDMRNQANLDEAQRNLDIMQKQLENSGGGTSGGSNYLDQIAGNTASTAGSAGSIEKSLGLAEEDIKSLVDVAEQRYVNRINLTAQSPVINITGANTGNTPADRQRLADQIRDVLVEQISSGSSRATTYAVSGA